MALPKVKIYTDGACSGNPGPGGWAALIFTKEGNTVNKEEIKDGEVYTTNNRMELTAVIESLKRAKEMYDGKCKIMVVSDSTYVINSINNKSIYKWSTNGWKTARGTDVMNKDLWIRMLKIIDGLKIKFVKVKGHSGDKHNDRVDKLAVEQSHAYKIMSEAL